jgi:cytochrome c1
MLLSKLIAAAFVVGTMLLATGCAARSESAVTQAAGGNPVRGKEKAVSYGCPACHDIAGIDIVKGQVGPPLKHIRTQSFLAGELPNTADNLTRWIEDPQTIKPHNAMPNTGVTDEDARDIAAYLYSTE